MDKEKKRLLRLIVKKITNKTNKQEVNNRQNPSCDVTKNKPSSIKASISPHWNESDTKTKDLRCSTVLSDIEIASLKNYVLKLRLHLTSAYRLTQLGFSNYFNYQRHINSRRFSGIFAPLWFWPTCLDSLCIRHYHGILPPMGNCI